MLLGVLAEVTPTPDPADMVDPNLVTPGPLGFAVIVVIVGLVVFLVWDMLRRVRTTRYRGEVREELDAEEAAARAGSSGGGADDADQPTNG